MNDLKIANENRDAIQRPDKEDEKQVEKFEKKLDGLEAVGEDPE